MLDQRESRETRCRNCRAPVSGAYCHQCGQRVIVGRWTAGDMLRLFVHTVTDLEAGFVRTVRDLFRRPAQVVSDYWRGKTVCYYAPFRYFLLWFALSLLINFWLGIDDLLQAALQPEALERELGVDRLNDADRLFDSWLNLVGIVLLPVNSLSTFLLFRKQRRTYGEHLILNGFAMGQLALISCLTNVALFLMPTMVIGYLVLSLALGIGYNAFVLTPLFRQGWKMTLAKATVQGVVGVAAFAALTTLATAIALQLS